MEPRPCLHCGGPIPQRYNSRSTGRYCKPAHRQAAYELRKNPDKGSVAAQERKEAWLDKKQYGQLKKVTVRALAKADLMPADVGERPADDVEGDPKRPYDVRWIRKSAKKAKSNSSRMPGYRGRELSSVGDWNDAPAKSHTGQRYRDAVLRRDAKEPVTPELEVALWHSSVTEKTSAPYVAFFEGTLTLDDVVRHMARIEGCRPNGAVSRRERLRLYKRHAERMAMTAEVLAKLERIEQQQARDALLASMRAEAQDSQMRAILASLAGEHEDDEERTWLNEAVLSVSHKRGRSFKVRGVVAAKQHGWRTAAPAVWFDTGAGGCHRGCPPRLPPY